MACPGFGFFFFRLGVSLEIDSDRITLTELGVGVIADQGVWPLLCACCRRSFTSCQGCVLPVFLSGSSPSEALPESLQVAAEVFDQWKVSGVRRMVKVQSFAFTLVEELVEKVCWKVLTRGERVGEERSVIVIFDSSWIEWFRPQVGLHFAVLNAQLCGVLDDCLVFMVGKEGFSYLARRWVGEDLRCLERALLSLFWVNNVAWSPLNWTRREHWLWAKCEGVRSCLWIFFSLTCWTLTSLSLGVSVIAGGSSLLCPGLFQFVLQFPHCTSFPGGGNRLGIHVEAGQLLLHGLGIASVVHAEVACGENVKGLIRHGHWPIIGLFAHMLGLRHLLVKLLELSHIAPMRRPRCFFLFSREKMDFPINEATELVMPKELWQLSDICVQAITEE